MNSWMDNACFFNPQTRISASPTAPFTMESPYHKKPESNSKPAHRLFTDYLQVHSVPRVDHDNNPLISHAQLSTAFQQVTLDSGIEHEIPPLTAFLQPQHSFRRPRSSLWTLPLPRAVPSMPVAVKPRVMTHVIRHYGRGPDSYVPATYRWGDSPFNVPGTAKYYRGRAFRQKNQADTAQAPDHTVSATGDAVECSGGVLSDTDNLPTESKSLVMIFSRTNIRRACENRKVHLRRQRKFWRGVSNEALFDWD